WSVVTATIVALVTTAIVLGVVGWDLSTADAQGRVFGMYSDALNGFQLLIVAVSVGLLTLVGAGMSPRFGQVAAFVGEAVAVVLISWRAGSARVVGANLWPLATLDLLIGGVLCATAGYLGGVLVHRAMGRATAKRSRSAR